MYCQNNANGHLAEPTSTDFLAKIQNKAAVKDYLLYGPHARPYWKYVNGTQVLSEVFFEGDPNNVNKFAVCLSTFPGKGSRLGDIPCSGYSFTPVCHVNSKKAEDAPLPKCSEPFPKIPCAILVTPSKTEFYEGEFLEYVCAVSGQTIKAICKRLVSDATNGDITMDWEYPNCEGVIRLGAECYHADPNASNITSWLDAEKYCQSKWSGHLAQPGSHAFLEALSAQFNLTTNATLFLGPHITYGDPVLIFYEFKRWYNQYECKSRETCGPLWKYANGTLIPTEFFADNEPGNQGMEGEKCLSAVFVCEEAHLADETCGYQPNHDIIPVCHLNSRNDSLQAASCKTSPFASLCGGFSEGPLATYERNTEETALCSDGSEIKATCLGEPFQWYYSGNLSNSCDLCNVLPKCSSPPPEILCTTGPVLGNRTEFLSGETVPYTCLGSEMTIWAVCNNGAWEKQTCKAPALYNQQCYYAAEETTRNFVDAEMYCQNTTNGHLAEPTGSLLSYLKQPYQPPSETLYLFGPHHTDSLYNCGGSEVRNASCLEVWKYSGGSEVPAETFGPTEPNNLGNWEVCLASRDFGLLADFPCAGFDFHPVCLVNSRSDDEN
ncbi:unnamed protein product, partial [Cyprideis torosa]